jgi:CO/xanthine dehydrogenase Mo-binding subunit
MPRRGTIGLVERRPRRDRYDGSVNVIGTATRRLEGRDKTTGATRFAGDLPFAGLAHARLLLSPYPAARIGRLDLAAASQAPGVLAAVSAADLPPVHASGPESPLADGRVYYAGQPVAAIVAETEAQAADAVALANADVDYEPMEAVVDPVEALRDGAPSVLEQVAGRLDDAGAHGLVGVEGPGGERPPNVTAQVAMKHGDAHAALAASDVVVEGRYVLPAVHQGFVEPHVAVAVPEPDGTLTIHTPTQGTFLTRQTVAGVLGIPFGDVRVVPAAVGGGFGGKVSLLEPLLALLARRVRRPVRLELSRTEEFLMGRGGPAAVVDLKLGADRAGTLKGLWARIEYDNGAGQGGLVGLTATMLGGAYRVPDLDIEGQDVATNKCPVAAYRAPGAPQAFFAMESALDELAAKLGQDPVELRLRNASREGDPRPDGSRWPRIGLVECLEAARRHPLYTAPKGPGEGLGVAVGGWGGGREPAAAGCRVEPDGTLSVQLGSVDISGTNTTMAMIAAETFGVPVDRVRIRTGDTAGAPYAGMAGGSKTTYTVGPAVHQAVAEARRQVLEIAAEELEAAPEDLEIAEGEVRVRGVPGRAQPIGHLAHLSMQFGGRYAPVLGQGRTAITEQSPMFTVHLARVRVDDETGEWRLTGYAAVQDVGRAINPPEIHGQVHGGALQGLARALGEEMRWDGEGQLRTASFLEYGIPSIDQVPEFSVELLEVPSPIGPFGAKGVGEPPAVPGPAVVANAIRDACGVRVTTLPIGFDELALR